VDNINEQTLVELLTDIWKIFMNQSNHFHDNILSQFILYCAAFRENILQAKNKNTIKSLLESFILNYSIMRDAFHVPYFGILPYEYQHEEFEGFTCVRDHALHRKDFPPTSSAIELSCASVFGLRDIFESLINRKVSLQPTRFFCVTLFFNFAFIRM